MKKAISIVLTAVMALTLFCMAVSADAVPQPEGGKKFESIWAKACGLIEIWYEEEGYRVMVDLFNQSDSTGTQWEYSCYYNEQKDILESVSARKFGYTLVPETMDVIPGECEYEEFGETDKTTVFSLTENGALKWEDGYENAGADLEFRDIGRFYFRFRFRFKAFLCLFKVVSGCCISNDSDHFDLNNSSDICPKNRYLL